VTTCTRLVPYVQGMVTNGSGTFIGSFSFVSALWGILYPHLWTGATLRLADHVPWIERSPAPAGSDPARIRAHGKHKPAKAAASFHKTGPGEYGEGLVFIGLNAATIHALSRELRDLPLDTVVKLLHSPIHDERTIALLVMVRQVAKGDSALRKRIFDSYLANTKHVNSWGLVDCSAPGIVGAYLEDQSRAVLDKLAKSKVLWERRIAILAREHPVHRHSVRSRDRDEDC
jgi:hypothetical protein